MDLKSILNTGYYSGYYSEFIWLIKQPFMIVNFFHMSKLSFNIFLGKHDGVLFGFPLQ